ncbi:hypothetical protein HZB08_00945, partial [Candidatus Saganbacteria bacterium]|nr:hypothetical protein [Candidatus Saganbacteria bacterium]
MEILELLENSAYFKERLSALKNNRKTFFSGLIGSAKSAVLAVLAGHFKNILVITGTSLEAESIREEIRSFSGRE